MEGMFSKTNQKDAFICGDNIDLLNPNKHNMSLSMQCIVWAYILCQAE